MKLKQVKGTLCNEWFIFIFREYVYWMYGTVHPYSF